MNYLNDIDVLVLGLGDSGLAMARWCARHGARVRVWDSREAAPQDAALAESLPQARRLRGALTDEAFAGGFGTEWFIEHGQVRAPGAPFGTSLFD